MFRVKGGDVVAPPYDIITPEMREALYARSPYNIVRIDSGKEREGDSENDNKYVRAARYFEKWQEEGILIRPPRPCFYAYEMDYRAEGQRRKLRGFFGLVRLQELGNGIYPHEETHSKPKVDRLNLMTACEANTSPIFSLYHSREKNASSAVERIAGSAPYMEAEDPDGALHRLWIIERENDISAISADLNDRAIYIADGHHRYETALEYRNRMIGKHGRPAENAPYNHVLMFLANIADGNITILPTHRIVKCTERHPLDRLARHFEIKTTSLDDDIIQIMRGKSGTLGFFLKGHRHQYLLKYKGEGPEGIHDSLKGLDVAVLHELIFKDLLRVSVITYEMNASLAREMVLKGDYDAVFFLNPTKVEQVESVALSLMRMPPKSTYFYPKVMTGFVINSLKNPL